MDLDKKISTPPMPPTPPPPPKPVAPPVPDLQTPRSTPILPAEETPEPIAAPVISRSTPLAQGLSAKGPISAPLPFPSLPPITPLSPAKQTAIPPAPVIPPATPTIPTIPKTPPQPIDNKIDLEEELAPKTLKYSIRTMAQDLERAKKEGVSPEFAAKMPTMPPPPPLRAAAPREAAKTPAPIAPTVKVAVVSPALTPPPSTPFAMPSARPVAMPPPAQKPSRISFAHLNLIIIIVSVVIIFIGSLGFSYWWFFMREAPITPIVEEPPIIEEPKKELPPVVKEPTLPKTIISTDQDIIIEVSEKSPSKTSTASLFSQISKSAKILDDKKLARVLFKYSSETEKQYLSFTESLAMLDITTPNSFIENITGGEILAYNQNGEMRYGLAVQIVNAVKMIDIMKDWENVIIDDLKNIYIEKTPTKPESMAFKDFSYESFISRYLSLPTPDISMTWGVSDAEKIFVIATSKDMMYKIIGYKGAEKPVLRTFSSGTLVRATGDTKIYRIIDDKKLWIPTVKAFIDSGYPVRSEIEILPEELAQYQDARYIKLKDAADIYEIKGDKKHLVANPQTLSPTEIKTATNAEFIAYPIANTTQSGQVVNDCGTSTNFQNSNCFINAVQNCSLAKWVVNGQFNLFGIISETATFYELKGWQNSKCIFYVKPTSAKVSYSQELIQEMLSSGETNERIKQQEQESSMLIQPTVGRDGTCKFDKTSDLTNLLNKWKSGSFSSDDFSGFDCTGEYFGKGEQQANTSKTITSEQCTAQKGIVRGVEKSGTACFKNETDLGTTTGPLKIDGKYPQCCVY